MPGFDRRFARQSVHPGRKEPLLRRPSMSLLPRNRSLVGTSRCDVPARVPAGGSVPAPLASNTSHVAPLVRGADGAARHPYLLRDSGSWFRCAILESWELPRNLILEHGIYAA